MAETKIFLNQIVDSNSPGSILYTNTANTVTYLTPGSIGEAVVIGPDGLPFYSNISGLSNAEFITGQTFSNTTYQLTSTTNSGSTFISDLSVLSSDRVVTGGTYNNTTGTITYITNSGTTFDVAGFVTGFTDNFVTGGTFDNGTGTITFDSNDTTSFDVTGFTDTDTFISGGTYDITASTLTLDNTTGGSINISGFTPTNTGLEAIDEGNGIGWRLIGRDPSFYGNVGLNAVDFSTSVAPLDLSGALGENSFVVGNTTVASGSSSFAKGSFTVAGGNNSSAEGSFTVASGENSHAEGFYSDASGNGSHVGGVGNPGLLTTDPNRSVRASGIASFNHSFVTIDGVSGVTGDYSAILGGQNNTLNGTRSAIIGGVGITGMSNDTVYVPNLNINSTLATGTSSTVLARAVDGSIIEVAVSSGGGTITGGTNGLSISGQNLKLGGDITEETELTILDTGNDEAFIINGSVDGSQESSSFDFRGNSVTTQVDGGPNDGSSISVNTTDLRLSVSNNNPAGVPFNSVSSYQLRLGQLDSARIQTDGLGGGSYGDFGLSGITIGVGAGDSLTINELGSLNAPLLTNTLIDSGDGRTLITKDYLTANTVNQDNTVRVLDLGTITATGSSISEVEAQNAIVTAYNALPVSARTVTDIENIIIKITLEEAGGDD